jgi:preprotein translocase subunit SecG
MATVLLIIHLMIASALVAVVLLQRSEGGALGIGGGGGFMTGRGATNFLTRITAGLATAFFVTSIALTLLANRPQSTRSIFDVPAPASAPATSKDGAAQPAAPATAPQAQPGQQPAQPAPGRGGILDKLQPSGPSVPQSK